MNILMLSWGVLPQRTGGLEEVTYRLLKYLDSFGHKVFLIIPNKTPEIEKETESQLKNSMIIGTNLEIERIGAYPSYEVLKKLYRKSLINYLHGLDFYLKLINEFAKRVEEIVDKLKLEFDVIYVNDWLTAPAGIILKKKYKKPLIYHVHSTSYDRSGTNIVHYLDKPELLEAWFKDYLIEKETCQLADRIIAISKRIKDILVRYYGADESKIRIVYNAVDKKSKLRKIYWFPIKKKYKIVLYLGRMFLHKGPDWLLKAAKKVLEKRKDVLFLFAGTGEMLYQLINMAAELGISKNVIFLGRVSDEEREFLYDIADVFVLPSVSEPFGLTPLEALQHLTPVIVSKQSGVAEVLNSALKVDFWDVDKMANYILSILEYPILGEYEVLKCLEDIKYLTWENSVRLVEKIIKELIQ